MKSEVLLLALSGGLFAQTAPSVTLSWTAPIQPAGVTWNAYWVYRSIFSDPPGTPAAQWSLLAAGVPETSYIDKIVTPGMKYWYYVTTVDTSEPRRGESRPSNVVSVVVPR